MRTQNAILACMIALSVHQCPALADRGLAYQQPADLNGEKSTDTPLRQAPDWINQQAESLRSNLHSGVQDAQRTLQERNVVIEKSPESIQQFGQETQQKAHQLQQETQANLQSAAE